MSEDKSPEEIRREMRARFDEFNDAAERRHNESRNSNAANTSSESERWGRRDSQNYITNDAGDANDTGDMGENDSSGG